MTTKPVEVPEWGTDLSNDVAPSGGQQTTGWTVDQLDVSSYDNWYKARTSLWLNYLNAGYLDVVDVYHGVLEVPLIPHDAICVTSCAFNAADYILASGVSEVDFNIPLKIGDRILSYVVELYGSGAGAATLSLRTQRVNGASTGGAARDTSIPAAYNGAPALGGGSTGAFVTTTDTLAASWFKRRHMVGTAGVGYVIGSDGTLTSRESVYAVISTPNAWRVGNVYVMYDRPRP